MSHFLFTFNTTGWSQKNLQTVQQLQWINSRLKRIKKKRINTLNLVQETPLSDTAPIEILAVLSTIKCIRKQRSYPT